MEMEIRTQTSALPGKRDPSHEEKVAPPTPFRRPAGPLNESTLKSSGPLNSLAVSTFCSKPRAVN